MTTIAIAVLVALSLVCIYCVWEERHEEQQERDYQRTHRPIRTDAGGDS